MINTEYREALVEVLEIINHLEEDEKSKIPSEIVEFYEKNKSKTYIPNINIEEGIYIPPDNAVSRRNIKNTKNGFVINDDWIIDSIAK